MKPALIRIQPDMRFTDAPFIIQGEAGRLGSQAFYCLVKYDSNSYTDRLFTILKQNMPEKLLTAVHTRRAEHLAGRYCCWHLLNQGAHCTGAVGSHRGIPLWPDGWTGSISHTAQYAIAVVVQRDTGLSAGIDIEQHTPTLFLDTAHLFTTRDEQRYLMSLSLPYSLALAITFSAKESLFKALYSEINRFIDFNMAYLSELDTVHKTFTLTLAYPHSERLFAGRSFQGQYDDRGDHIITFFLIRR